MKLKLKRYLCYLMIFLIAFTVYSAGSNTDAAAKYYPMQVSYINVGESDSVLIQSDGKNMLIDAGDTDDDKVILNYLKSKKINKLDYIIATHPHEDHIGAMDDVIKKHSVGKVIMPIMTHTTKAYSNLVTTIKNKGLKITKPVVGTKYTLGKASFTILSPNHYNYGDNINNYSVGIKLVNGNDSFIFLGDNETEAIDDILANKINIKADVLMCGHHGSKTSTNEKLLNAIDPDFAIISVGKNNYGHPSDSTLNLLAKKKVKTYRTDKSGTIIASSTGTKITFNAKPTEIKPAKSTDSSTAVYITKTGKKYHLSNCPYLNQSKIKTTLKDAKAKKLTPCSRCNPPK